MLQHNVTIEDNDPLYLLSEKFAKVSSTETLLEAIVSLPRVGSVSVALIYGQEPSMYFDSTKLHPIARQVNIPIIADSEWALLFRDTTLDESYLIQPTPIFLEDVATAQNRETTFQRISAVSNLCSSIILPLKANDNWIGLIYLGWNKPQIFSEADKRLFTILAHQASWVIYGVGLYKDIQERIKRTEALLELSTMLSQAGNEHEILQAIASATARFDVDTLLLTYLDMNTQNNTSTLTVMARWSQELGSPLPKQMKLGRSRSIPEFLKKLLSGIPEEPFLIEELNHLTQGTDPAQLERTGFDSKTTVLLPLYNGTWQGLVCVNWKENHIFSDEEKSLYPSLIQVLSSIIASRRAYLDLEAARYESEQRAKELETVSKVSAAATQNLDFEQLLQTVVDLSTSSFNLYNTHVYLLDPTQQYLNLAATAGEAGKAMKALGNTKISLARDPSIAAQCGRLRDGIIVNDVSRSPEFIPNPLLPEIRAEMAVPMILGDRIIGVLDLQSKEINRFTPNVLLVMRALADEIAVAVQNVRLFEEQFKVAQELRNLDKLKNQFLATMSHELRTPLNAILNFTHFVSTGIFGPVNEKQVDTLGKVSHSATHLLRLINDVLDFSKIEAGMMELFWEDVDLNLVVESVMETANGIPRAEGVELIAEIESNLPSIRGDKQRLRQILLNLLSNALKFTEQGKVVISVRRQEDNIHFSVSDTGSGIAPEDMETIFEAFKQTPDGVSKGGTGLGLPISKHLVEAHGGKLSLTSELKVGTTFLIVLPLK